MSFALVLIFIIQSFGRLALNSSECLIYLSKLEKLKFDDDLNFDSFDNKIKISFGYFDPLFYNDTYWGLTADDGKPIDSTCLDVKIWIFKSEKYQDLLYNKNPELQLQNSSWSWREKRNFAFAIDVAIFQKKFFLESDHCNVYFGIIYYAAGTNQVLRSQRFYFQFKFNPWSTSSLPASFKPNKLETAENCTVGHDCVVKNPKYFFWCIDLTCKDYYEPEFFVLYEIYVIKQKLSFLEADKIFDTNLMLIGNGSRAFMEPLQQIYASNYVILQFSFNSLVNQGLLKSDIIFSSSNKNYSITGQAIISCIKINAQSACSTCWEQCEFNHGIFEMQCDCPWYNSSKILIFIVFFWLIQ